MLESRYDQIMGEIGDGGDPAADALPLEDLLEDDGFASVHGY